MIRKSPIKNRSVTIAPFYTWRTAILKSNLEPNCKFLLLTISCHMSEMENSAFPSLTTLQKETGLTRPTISKHIKSARANGWLSVKSRKRTNGASTSNLYAPTIPGGQLNHLTPLVKPFNPNVNSSVKPNRKKLNKKTISVIQYLNRITGKAFKTTGSSNKEIIAARLNDGFSVADCEKVIDNKSQDQFFIDNPQYMCPATLFQKSKFETYLNSPPKKLTGENDQTNYDTATHKMVDGKMEEIE